MKKNWFYRLLIGFTFLLGSFLHAYAEPLIEPNALQSTNEMLRVAQIQLQLEQQRQQTAEQDLQNLIATQKNERSYFGAHAVSAADLKKVSLTIATAKASLGNIQIALADANENILFTKNEISETKKHADRIKLQIQVDDTWKKLLQIQSQRQDYLNQTQNYIQQYLQQLQAWKAQLEIWRNNQLRHQEEFTQVANEEKLQLNQQKLLEKLTKLTSELNVLSPSEMGKGKREETLQFQIFLTQENLSLNHLDLFLSQFQNRMRSFVSTLPGLNSVADLEERGDKVESALNKLMHVKLIINDKIELLKKTLSLSNKTDLSVNAYKELINKYQNEYQKINVLQKQVENANNQIIEILNHRFTIRQTLPGFDLAGWKNIGSQILGMPNKVWATARDGVRQLWAQFKYQESWHFYGFIFLELMLLVSWWFLRKTFRQLFRWLAESSLRFSSQFLRVVLTVIGRNLGIIWVIIALSLVQIMFGITNFSLFISFTVIYFFYQSLRMLLKTWLLENAEQESKKNTRLFHQLCWALNFGGLLTGLVVLTHVLPVSYEVKTLINKMFMLLFLVSSLFLFRASSILPMLLQRIFVVKKNYILQILRLICWVLPITLFTNAVIGLVGYVDLAWLIGRYQVTALVVLVAYILARGIVIDFMELNYELMIRHFKFGWLWAQAFLKPLDRILRIALFLTALFIVLHDFGLDHNKTLLNAINKIFSTPLIAFGGNVIRLDILIGAFFFVAVLAWLARWSREFAFRWLFSGSKDVGLRNSLAVFTQYIVVILGVLIGLKVFGVDLKGLAFIAAAFAAGIGFALRDLAGNFISGIMLLIERPFRTGDTITLGEHEGIVTNTGIRSLKIQTWDHLEVIVPNTDMFTKPFVNWTHQDSIVRTVIKISVDRGDDPHLIQKIVYEALRGKREVVNDPKPEVFMKEMGESFDFEIRYFINLKEVESRPRIRSDILFAIWDTFKKHDIKVPYPQYDVRVMEKNTQPHLPVEKLEVFEPKF
jgi:potassium efflux system protein